MTHLSLPPIKSAGIVGAGAMGKGIAQLCVQAGVRTFLHDSQKGAIDNAISFINKIWNRQVEKGLITHEQASEWSSLLSSADQLQDIAGCDLIIEAIIEKLLAKQDLFQSLESLASKNTILATNTSSLSIAAIASECKHPERVIGFHFFNPAPLMKVVEIIPGHRTSEAVVVRVKELGNEMGHFTALTTDTPGFLINHAGRAYITEALKLLGEKVADHYTIDCILTSQGGFRMGPFSLMDLTALDVTHIATEAIYHQYYGEPKLRPSIITKRRLEAGLLGRKSGEGFYSYTDGNMTVPSTVRHPVSQPVPIWIGTEDESAKGSISRLIDDAGWHLEKGKSPSSDALCIITPLGEDAANCILRLGIDPKRCIAVDTFGDLSKHRTIMTNPATLIQYKNAALTLFSHDGTPVSAIRDSNGFVFQRVIACIVNVACDIAQQGIATPATIDKAVVLGLGYPIGPLAIGDHYGSSRILSILQSMHRDTGDPRYRPSPWLRRRANLSLSLSHTEI